MNDFETKIADVCSGGLYANDIDILLVNIGMMCRHQVSIGWDGTLYDCDFNLALGLAVDHGAPNHIENFNLSDLVPRRIVTGTHCFGCTAGCGSSCGGALLH